VAGPARTKLGIAAMCRSMPEYLEWVELAEACGYELAGYGDTQNLLPDAYVALSAMAMRTSRIKLCTTVSNPVTRHPSVAASGFAALQQLSGGRAIFGIGTGDSAVKNMGGRAATVDAIRRYCLAFRDLVDGRTTDYDGTPMRLLWSAPSVPFYLAAEGPRMMQLAGEIADGVIFGNGISDEVVDGNLAAVRGAAQAAGRDPDTIEPWFLTKVVLSDEPEEELWHRLAWTLAASANHAFLFTFAGKHVPVELEAPLRRLMADYRSHEHNQVDTPGHNAALVNDNGLTEFLGRRFLIGGTPEHVAGRIRALADRGATNLLFTAMWGDPLGYTRRIAEEVMPLL
jgi:5,10-methylenetetrahydromethanopterin reductase